LGTTKKVYIKLLQINLPPGQGGIIQIVFKFNQNKVKPPPAKWAEEIGSKSIVSSFIPFFPQENRFTVFLPGHYPISQRVGRTAGGKKGLD
jgi:hypothetical protein